MVDIFKGRDSHIINMVANDIQLVRDKLWSERREAPKLIAYVGHKQHVALMCIEPRDRYAVQKSNVGEFFLETKLIKVQADSYLHVVEQ